MHAWPKKMLMVRPTGFRVDYAINPYMVDDQGELRKVDSALAMRQWENLKHTFEKLGQEVEVIEGDARFPDMVFCANQTLPIGPKEIVLSRMHAQQRQGEVQFFRAWAEHRGYAVHAITDCDFEGAGDAIWNYETGELLAGCGPRSKAQAYDNIAELTGAKIHPLETVSRDFYHMDTCLAVLNGTTAAYVPEAFTLESQMRLKEIFGKLIAVDASEARAHFTANCVSLDGKHVVLQEGASRFLEQLRGAGFRPVEVDVSEFMKAGGAVFCLKQRLF